MAARLGPGKLIRRSPGFQPLNDLVMRNTLTGGDFRARFRDGARLAQGAGGDGLGQAGRDDGRGYRPADRRQP